MQISIDRTKKMKILIKITLLILFFCTQSVAQNVLTADKFGTNRKKWYAGDRLTYRLKTADVRFSERVLQIGDSVIFTESIKFDIKELDKIYFRRRYSDFMVYNGAVVGCGFLFAALVAPLVSNKRYDERESLVIGSSFLFISQSFRVFRWKKYPNDARSRIRILNLTY
jgi:hypothetical protein